MSRGIISQPKRPPPVALVPGWRLLLVDGDHGRRQRAAEAIEKAGAPEPATAGSGDEALDVLGAEAQQFRLVAAWMPLTDDADVDMVGVLRRCRSPVRLLVLTTLGPNEYPRAGRLAGATAIEDPLSLQGLLAAVRQAALNGVPIADIIDSQRVPDRLSPLWAVRVYGARPGTRFQAKLD
jgi:hypothetical protein